MSFLGALTREELRAVLVILGFLIGSIPFGLILGRVFFRSDIRTQGSGNIGAANALRTFGRGAGIAVLLLDAFKGALSVGIAYFVTVKAVHDLAYSTTGPATQGVLTPEFIAQYFGAVPYAGLAAVIGHCYSPWLRFRGGKGVATFLGATIAISPLSGLVFGAVWIAIAVPTGFASAASLGGTLAAGAALVIVTHGSVPAFVYAFGCAAVIFWRHRENIARLRAGTETKTEIFKRR